MAVNKTCFYILAVIGMFLLSCGEQSIETEEAFYRWINDTSNGLKKQRTVGDLELTVTYLPSAYLRFRNNLIMEGKSSTGKEVGIPYTEDLHFLLTIKSKTGSENIIYKDVTSYQAYKDKTIRLNFESEKSLKLVIDEQEYQPSLAVWENLYNLGTKGKLNVSFSGIRKNITALSGSTKLDLVFTDEVFGTGIHHFVFQKADLDHIPVIDLAPKD